MTGTARRGKSKEGNSTSEGRRRKLPLPRAEDYLFGLAAPHEHVAPVFSSPLRLPLSLLCAAFLPVAAAVAQSVPITSVVTTALTDPDGQLGTTTVNGLVFQNASYGVSSFSTAGTTYNVTSLADQAFIRRNSSPGSAPQSSIWYANDNRGAPSVAGQLLGGQTSNYQGGVGSILLSNNLTRGSDNTFANGLGVSDGNIERIDFVFSAGLTVTPGLAFTVLDRGATNAHDGFKIAAITGWDSLTNTPTSYQLLVNQNAGWGATNSVANFDYTLLRYRASDNGGDANNLTAQYATATGNQGIAGLVFTAAALGLSNGQPIYGYSLFAGDVTDGGNTANLINFNNATFFPTGTSGNGAGGLDLAAVNGLALQDIAFSAVPEPSTYALGGVVVMMAGIWGRHRRRHLS